MKALRHGDPASVGPFQLAARLGRGGMGVVYLGVDAAGRQAAVKVLREEFTDDPDFVRRFSREVTTAAAIDSPRVARLLEAGLEAEQPWLASEYVPGSDLQTRVARHGPLPADRLRTLAIELASALVAIHQAGVVHRDLKPSNVMLAPDGAKVIDFGIAAGLPGTVTATGVVLGSVGYMAPELLDTDVRSGPAADVFALGLTLAYAATGRPPFGNGPLASLLYRTVHVEPDLMALPRPLRTVIATTVRKQPDCRPSASRLLDELFTASPAGGPATAPMEEPAPMAQPATAHGAAEAGGRRRRRALVPVAGMLVALAAATGLLAASDPETAGQPSAAAHGNTPKVALASPPASRPPAGTTAPPAGAVPDGGSTVGQDAGSSVRAASAHSTGSAATSAQGAPAVPGQPVVAAPASDCAASGTDGAASDDACQSDEDGGGSQSAARNGDQGPPPWAGQPGGPKTLLTR